MVARRLIAVLKSQQIVFQGHERREIVRCQDLALHHREVDSRSDSTSSRGVAYGPAGSSASGAPSQDFTAEIGQRPARHRHAAVHGRSQAMRFTSTMTLGGKAGCAPASWLFVEASEPFAEKPLAPLADDLARRIQPGGNNVVRPPFGGQQHEFGANDVAIR